MSERIQKVLAQAGIGSRRELEEWIKAGRIKVDGAVAQLGMRIAAGMQIQIDDRLLSKSVFRTSRRRVLLYYKLEGEICTRLDPQGRPTVFQRLPALSEGRWILVGRLDINSSGLLLLTTDGELARRLMHPRWQIEREYAVRVLGKVDKLMLERLKQGVQLEDGFAHFTQIKAAGGEGANQWYHVVIQEGRKREVRRLWESQGVKVSRLMRIRYGVISLPKELHRGRALELNLADTNLLAASVDLAPSEELKVPLRKPQGSKKFQAPDKPRILSLRSKDKSPVNKTDNSTTIASRKSKKAGGSYSSLGQEMNPRKIKRTTVNRHRTHKSSSEK